jgi:hypothetical protein
VDAIAGLTAVDGATIITDRYDLLAFGAKITRRRGSPPVEQTTVTEPIEGGTADIVHPSSLGGTRHLSAAQFAHDQQDSIALVASQDGHFTVFAWSPAKTWCTRTASKPCCSEPCRAISSSTSESRAASCWPGFGSVLQERSLASPRWMRIGGC